MFRDQPDAVRWIMAAIGVVEIVAPSLTQTETKTSQSDIANSTARPITRG